MISITQSVEVDVDISFSDLSASDKDALFADVCGEHKIADLADAFYRGHDAVIQTARDMVYAATGRIV